MVLRDFTGRTRLWIEVGQPEDRPVAKACSQADAVAVYAYSPGAEIWWRGVEGKLVRLAHLSVWRIPAEQSQALQALAQRSMHLQATIQEGHLLLGDGRSTAEVEPVRWK